MTGYEAPGAVRLFLHQIRTDGGTQPREAIDPEVVKDYSTAMVEGATFPPVVVYHDGTDYWLADGFHRVRAAEAAGFMEIDCQILQGTQRNAIMFSLGANDMHGLRRTNADKRRAVMRMLEDVEWSAWSDREIARACKVSNHLVASLRSDVTRNSPSEKKYTTKHGTTATMNTANIGTVRAPDPVVNEMPLEEEAPKSTASRPTENRRPQEPRQEPEPEQTGSPGFLDEAIVNTRTRIDYWCLLLGEDIARHEYVNTILKYIRTIGIEFNKSA
jgi:hypothetical protein